MKNRSELFSGLCQALRGLGQGPFCRRVTVVVCAIAGAMVLAPVGGNLGSPSVSAAATPNDLVLTVEVSASTSVSLPIEGITSALTVDWGDGSTPESVTTDKQSHTYSTAGDYTIIVSGGAFSSFTSSGISSTSFSFTGLSQWGTYLPTSGIEAFWLWDGDFTVPSDLPSSMTQIYRMFYGASSFNGDLSSWDTSNVTDMYSMFYGASS
ncbi:MAG: BspA family leucine-rich repeat surface protein, partial [Actinomycetota bacterium]|nr:BspA family leucine-rich repeat surface protein [Actinomycetota bacterium]